MRGRRAKTVEKRIVKLSDVWVVYQKRLTKVWSKKSEFDFDYENKSE